LVLAQQMKKMFVKSERLLSEASFEEGKRSKSDYITVAIDITSEWGAALRQLLRSCGLDEKK